MYNRKSIIYNYSSSLVKESIVTGCNVLRFTVFSRLSLSRRIPQNLFHEKVLGAFANAADAVFFCKYFGFTALHEQSYENYKDSLRFFISTVLFHFPSLKITESYKGNAYLYHFEEPSPYGGPSHGLPVYGQCAVFLYGAEREKWPESAQKVALEMAQHWITFAYGKEPWQPYTVAGQLMRFGANEECDMRALEKDSMRDYEYLGWLRCHYKESYTLVSSLM